MTNPNEAGSTPVSHQERDVRFRKLRVVWLPLLLILLNAVLIFLSLLILVVFFVVMIIVQLVIATMKRIPIPWIQRRRSSRGTPADSEEAVIPVGSTTLTEEQRTSLAARFRPMLSVFPEQRDLGPPYQADSGFSPAAADYHPRSVKIFLENVRLRKGRTQWLPELPEVTNVEDIRASLGTRDEPASSLEIPWLHGGNPLKIVRHLFPFTRILRARWALPMMQRSSCGCAEAAWERYIDILQADASSPEDERRYPHTIYARVLQGREHPDIGAQHALSDAVVVQYWWFFFYNDAWNRHQGDWEGITIFLAGADAEPLGAAYAAHDLGRWRRWQDVQRVGGKNGGADPKGSHPVVYVGRGSHASYFDYNENGYHPSMSRELRIPFVGDYSVPSQFILESRNAIDWVADSGSPFSFGEGILPDRVEVMPHEAILRDLAALRADDTWWWLAYRGLWGAPEFLPFSGGSGPRGPLFQGEKWTNPFRWVMRGCIADDLPYWLETFSQWHHEEEEAEEEEESVVRA